MSRSTEPIPKELSVHLADPDMQAAPRALFRAAKHARELARQTRTPLVFVRDGVLVQEMVEDDDAQS
jgi:hypothetical protein